MKLRKRKRNTKVRTKETAQETNEKLQQNGAVNQIEKKRLKGRKRKRKTKVRTKKQHKKVTLAPSLQSYQTCLTKRRLVTLTLLCAIKKLVNKVFQKNHKIT